MWWSLSLSCSVPGPAVTLRLIPPFPAFLPRSQLLSQPMGAQHGGWTRGHVITAANQSAEKGVAALDSCRAPLYTV